MSFTWFKEYDSLTLTLGESLFDNLNEMANVVPEKSVSPSLEEIIIQEEDDLMHAKVPWEKSLTYSRFYFVFQVQRTLVKIISMIDLFFKSEYVFTDNIEVKYFLQKAYQLLYIEKHYIKDFWHKGNVAQFVIDRLLCSSLRLQWLVLRFHKIIFSLSIGYNDENFSIMDADESTKCLPLTSETLIPFINYIRASLGSMLKKLTHFFEKHKEELMFFMRLQTLMAEFLTSNVKVLSDHICGVLTEEDIEKQILKILQRNRSAMVFAFDEFKNSDKKIFELENSEEDPNRITKNIHSLMFKRVLQDINTKVPHPATKPKSSILKSSMLLRDKIDMIETDILSPVIQSNENSWVEVNESDIVKKKNAHSQLNFMSTRIKDKISFIKEDNIDKEKAKANPGFQKYLETLNLGKPPLNRNEIQKDSKSVLNSQYFDNIGLTASLVYLPKAKIETQTGNSVSQNNSKFHGVHKQPNTARPLKSLVRTKVYEEKKINNLLDEVDNNTSLLEKESQSSESATFNNPYEDLNKMLSTDLLRFIEGNSVPSEDIDFDEKINSKDKKREAGARRKVARDQQMTLYIEQLAQDIDLDTKKSSEDEIRGRPSSKEKKMKEIFLSSQTLTTEATEGKGIRRNDKKKTSKKLGIEENDFVKIDAGYEISEKLEYKPFTETPLEIPLDEEILLELTSEDSELNEEERINLREFEKALQMKIANKSLGVLELIKGIQEKGFEEVNPNNSMKIFNNESEIEYIRKRSETREYEKVNMILEDDNFDDINGVIFRKPYSKKQFK